MLARSSNIIHPSGLTIQTPILISSFSSKGFRFIKNGKKQNSEAFELVQVTAEALTEAVLLSAYDLKYYYPPIKNFRNFSFAPQVLFIDSGGYETLEDFDFSEAYRHPVKIKKWDLSLYEKVLSQWPGYYPAIIVSYDHGSERRIDLRKQIDRANKLRAKFPNHPIDFLVKPSRKGGMLDISEIVANVSLLKDFTIIGLTEKELGESILERMQNIKKVREALDSVSNKAPIHIFGNLDPLTSVLYFLSGAEVFDGLTWLRFSYHGGKAVYDQNIDAIKGRIEQKDILNKKMSMYENIIYLSKLKQQMKSFLKEYKEGKGDEAFKAFEFNSEKILKACKTLYSS
jgi:ribosomal protein S20